MAKTANRIEISGEFEYVQKIAADAISPGQLMALNSTDEYTSFIDNTEGLQKLFALEDALQGKTIDGEYALGDQVFGIIPRPGSKVQCRVEATSIINIGAPLYASANNNGQLTPTKGTAVMVIGFAEQAILSPATAGEFCQIRIA